VSASLRIARLDGSSLTPFADQAQLFQNHAALTRVIRRHLPPLTASLFATPRPVATDDTVEWYSDLAGQPTPLTALPAAEQATVRQILTDRLGSIAQLAEELPRLDPDAADLANSLRQAIQYPGDDYVYVVGGQPVIAFWGHTDPNRSPPVLPTAIPGTATVAADSAGATVETTAASPRKAWTWLVAAPILLLMAAALAWWYWTEQQQQLQTDLLAQFDAARGDCVQLWALTGKLEQLDPDATRYPDLRRQVDAELDLCRLAEDFEQQLAAATGDCTALAALAESMQPHPTDRPPLQPLKTRLDAQLEECRLTDEFNRALAAAAGDCDKLAALAESMQEHDLTSAQFQIARNQLDNALAQCGLASDLTDQLAAATGDCAQLAALDQTLRGYNTQESPLRELRQQLDADLELCRLAAQFEQRLADAGGDCQRLQTLDQNLANYDTSTAPLSSIRQRLDAELSVCQKASALAEELAAARGDCARLERLSGKLSTDDSEQLRTIRNQVDAELEKCRIAAEFEQKLDAAGNDCKQLAQLDKTLPSPDSEQLRTIRNRLDNALERCRRPPPAPQVAQKPPPQVAQKPPAPAPAADRPPPPEPPPSEPKPRQPPPNTDPLQLCPGERPKELAPDLALVFDASSSMGERIPSNPLMAQQILRQLNPFGALMDKVIRDLDPSLPRRIDVAKRATHQIVRELPADVDIGLVLVEDCPRARPIGFFSAAQRGQLLRGIDSISPVRRTPLASGLVQAGRMVDGVNAPGIIVVVSDGEESCGVDPCAIARQLKQRKPRLIINVVDIMGAGAGNCLAQYTGGRVYTADNAQDFAAKLHSATQEVRGPANCVRRNQ